MFYQKPLLKIFLFAILIVPAFSGCTIFRPSDKYQSATLLKTENATQEELIGQVNHFAKVNSMYAKMDLKFEDNSYAELGVAEKYKTVVGLVVVQRPANIQMKVQVPFINKDVVQMTSNGEKFRVAILEDGGSGKYKNFIIGSNDADYSILQKEAVEQIENNGNAKELKQNVNAFANLRPQHFTDAMLMRPVDPANFLYVQSTIMQEEMQLDAKNKKIVRWQLRGYYLLDEFRKNSDGSSVISRRFWFDRVGKVRLARQQIFDAKGEIESDIVYGQEGNLTQTENYKNLPLQIVVTRPQEKYKMRLTADASRLARLDPVSRLAVSAAASAIERAAGPLPARCGVIVGTAAASIEINDAFDARRRQRGARAVEPRRFPATSPNLCAGEISIVFGLRGPSLAVGAGLAAATEALAVAVELLESGDAEALVVVAVDHVGPAVSALWSAAGWQVPESGAGAVLLGAADLGLDAPAVRELHRAAVGAGGSLEGSAPGWPALTAAVRLLG